MEPGELARTLDARLAERIREIRLARGMSLGQLGAAIGLSRQGMSAIELGKTVSTGRRALPRPVSSGEAVELCRALGVGLAALLDEAPAELPKPPPVDWEAYRKCKACGAEMGEPCAAQTGARFVAADRPHGGRQPRVGYGR
jgi:transcriptional regulator with XRE-family HTH domain